MRKIFLTLLFLLSGVILLNAQTGENPFAKYGFKKVRAYTSSKGEFEEFHDNKDIVEIGSVLFDTKTNQVIGYAEEVSEVAAAIPAMSIDPLCEKYYWISPYAYCMNNPVRYVDPDGRDGMVTGKGTKEDPYIITAVYYYNKGSLNNDQLSGLNAAISSYNKSGGKDGVKVKNADGSESYVKYNLSSQGVNNADEARTANTTFVDSNGNTRYYGNIVNTNPDFGGNGDEYGSAHNFEVSFNPTNLAAGVASGMNSSSLHKGVIMHEIGHNLGGEHEHGTSVMDAVTTTIRTSQIGGTTTTTYSYPSMSNGFTKIIYGLRDTQRQRDGAGRLWTRGQ